ncbi:hypothetical protein N9174_04760, partial [bacterium]|nr:hypothetical protein [bacterium]
WFCGGTVVDVALTDYDQGLLNYVHSGLNFLRHETITRDVQDGILISLAGIAAMSRKALEIGELECIWDTEGGREDCITTMARLFLIEPRSLEGCEDVESFYMQYGREAREFMRSDMWPVVEAVANALLAKRKLTGQEAVAIILDNWDGELMGKPLPIEQHKTNDKED